MNILDLVDLTTSPSTSAFSCLFQASLDKDRVKSALLDWYRVGIGLFRVRAPLQGLVIGKTLK